MGRPGLQRLAGAVSGWLCGMDAWWALLPDRPARGGGAVCQILRHRCAGPSGWHLLQGRVGRRAPQLVGTGDAGVGGREASSPQAGRASLGAVGGLERDHHHRAAAGKAAPGMLAADRPRGLLPVICRPGGRDPHRAGREQPDRGAHRAFGHAGKRAQSGKDCEPSSGGVSGYGVCSRGKGEPAAQGHLSGERAAGAAPELESGGGHPCGM